MARYLTTQQYDVITYCGKTSVLVLSPLESHPDRQVLERIGAIVWRTPRLRRGYIARWAIEDGKVFLTGLDVRTGQRGRYTRRKPKLKPLPLEQIFPDVHGPIHASWIDGVLLLGETHGLLERLGVNSTFVLESILSVDAGVVESTLTLQTLPNMSTIGRTMGTAARRLLPKLFGALPSKLSKLRLRWRGAPRP